MTLDDAIELSLVKWLVLLLGVLLLLVFLLLATVVLRRRVALVDVVDIVDDDYLRLIMDVVSCYVQKLCTGFGTWI